MSSPAGLEPPGAAGLMRRRRHRQPWVGQSDVGLGGGMSLRLMLARIATAKAIFPARHWVVALGVSSFSAACTIPDEPTTPAVPVADPGPDPWTVIAVAGVIPPATDDEDPPPVSWEVDPWADDWTVSAPHYRPGPPCEAGVAARIAGRAFGSWDDAVGFRA